MVAILKIYQIIGSVMMRLTCGYTSHCGEKTTFTLFLYCMATN